MAARAVDEAIARLQTVKADLQALLELEPLHTRVVRLRCFRGINDLTALTIAAELGDPRRFATAPSTMAYVGLVPSEQSDSSSLPLGRSDDRIRHKKACGNAGRFAALDARTERARPHSHRPYLNA